MINSYTEQKNVDTRLCCMIISSTTTRNLRYRQKISVAVCPTSESPRAIARQASLARFVDTYHYATAATHLANKPRPPWVNFSRQTTTGRRLGRPATNCQNCSTLVDITRRSRFASGIKRRYHRIITSSGCGGSDAAFICRRLNCVRVRRKGQMLQTTVFAMSHPPAFWTGRQTGQPGRRYTPA